MRTKDYEAEYSRTVRIFLASVFLLHILFSWVRAHSFRVPFRQLSARPYRTLALISVKGRKLTTRPHILFLVEFVFAEIASTSQTIRTSFFTMLALVWSSGRFLTAKTHIPKLSSKRHRLKPFEVSPHDCKQSFASNLRTVIAYERLFSHPIHTLRLLLRSTLQEKGRSYRCLLLCRLHSVNARLRLGIR